MYFPASLATPVSTGFLHLIEASAHPFLLAGTPTASPASLLCGPCEVEGLLLCGRILLGYCLHGVVGDRVPLIAERLEGLIPAMAAAKIYIISSYGQTSAGVYVMRASPLSFLLP